MFVPYATIQNWVEAGGKKAARRIPTDYLDGALSDFSGSIAAAELDDGPFCDLSIVDKRTFQRLGYQVLSRDPTQRDLEAFVGRFHQALKARGLVLPGITTDGSSLDPEPIAAVCGVGPHQVCTFHVLRALIKAVLSTVAKVRKSLAGGVPKVPRGRPAHEADRAEGRRPRRAPPSLRQALAAGDDVQRGGARQPLVPENAEDDLPGADPTDHRGPLGAGPAAREAGARSGRDDQDLAQGESGMMR